MHLIFYHVPEAEDQYSSVDCENNQHKYAYAQKLLKYNAEVNAQNHEGMTPLHL